jgi:ribonuclease P protein component
MQRLKRRKEFLAAARAASRAAPGVVVQMRRRGDEDAARIGFTVTKKLGGAVERNRIRRRIKEAVRLALPGRVLPGRDYVFIGRPEAKIATFQALAAGSGGRGRARRDISHQDRRRTGPPIKSLQAGSPKPDRPETGAVRKTGS